MLKLLKNLVPVNCIIDVGVLSGTKELMDIFPGIKHLLFELNPAFFSTIEKNYCDFDYQLYKFGLSSESKDVYGVSLSNKRDGVVSHTQIQEIPTIVDGKFVLGCELLKLHRFNDIEIEYEKDFLLKIDVDGHDIEVLKGFEERIKDASIIQIEATYKRMSYTIHLLHRKGFRLISIVDQMHYGPSIWQCDLIFVRDELVNNTIAPNIHVNFDKSLYRCMS